MNTSSLEERLNIFLLHRLTKLGARFQNDSIIVDLGAALANQGISVFRFDFSGNGYVARAIMDLSDANSANDWS